MKHFHPDEIQELGYLVFGQPAKQNMWPTSSVNPKLNETIINHMTELTPDALVRVKGDPPSFSSFSIHHCLKVILIIFIQKVIWPPQSSSSADFTEKHNQ